MNPANIPLISPDRRICQISVGLHVARYCYAVDVPGVVAQLVEQHGANPALIMVTVAQSISR